MIFHSGMRGLLNGVVIRRYVVWSRLAWCVQSVVLLRHFSISCSAIDDLVQKNDYFLVQDHADELAREAMNFG
jgi:hypothetical protein